MNAHLPHVILHDNDEGAHRDGVALPPADNPAAPSPASGGAIDPENPADGVHAVREDAARTMEPLDDEQMALYRSRMESGFYRTIAVRQHIAERLILDVTSDAGK